MVAAISWTEIADRLAAARDYWLVSASRQAIPHAVPVWGVVLDSALYLYSERRTLKSRNIAENPHVVVHLGNGEDVVIVHGQADDLGAPAETPAVVQALAAKYSADADAQYLPSANPDFDVLYVVRPRRAMTWRLNDYDNSQGRWSAT